MDFLLSWIPQVFSALPTISFLVILYVLYWFASGRFQQFRQTSVAGPNAKLFVGNADDLMRHGYMLHLQIDEYYKKYGEIFGFFHHGKPVLVVGKDSLVTEILTKQATKFRNRKFIQSLPWPCSRMVTMAQDDHGKFLRQLLSPVFTPKNIKNMAPIIDKAADTMMQKFNEAASNQKPVDLASLSEGFIMEILLSLAFSIDGPNQSDLNKQLVELGNQVMQPPYWTSLVSLLPFGTEIAKLIPSAFQKPLQPLIDTATKLVAERRTKTSEEYKDLLAALLNAQAAGPDKNGFTLTDADILAQGIVLVTAVLIMSGKTLAAALFELASNKRVQETLHKELHDIFSHEEKNEEDSNEKTVDDKKYLDKVLKETLRLYPSGFVLMRECNESCTIEDVHFEKGQTIYIPVYSMHRDSAVWKNPDSFEPERFSDGTSITQEKYRPFGGGPKMCVGYRLAQAEIKTVLTKVIKTFHLEAVKPSKREMRSHISVQASMSFPEPPLCKVALRDREALQ